MINSAKEFSGTALIVLTSSSVEASDAEIDELKLTDNQAALIDKIATNFDNVIIRITSYNVCYTKLLRGFHLPC